jgi:NRAMP (natural resistance-associated macrophage protein)-like metal ion transporter
MPTEQSEAEPDEASAAKGFAQRLGPGLITGAADDDPSGIATYSQAGAQFGFGLLWMILVTYPLMTAIQMVSARIGRVTGHGLATNIRKHYPAWLLYFVVVLLLVANTINIAADVSAMGEAATLIVGGSAKVYTVIFGVGSLLLQIFVPYHRYVRVLKYLTLALLAYVGVVFTVHIDWWAVAKGTLMPRLLDGADYITVMVAVFGTTISPYLFFWQASEEVEDLHAKKGAKPLIAAPDQARGNFRRIKLDTAVGMGFSNLIAFFIMLTTAVTLNTQGVTDIQTSAQAASALKPVAGNFAFALFSLGIIGTGLLAIPVLAGSAAYAMAGTFRWRNSLELPPSKAKGFYSIIAVSTLIGIGIGFLPIDPIKALFWSAVINGVISIPIMVVMMLMAGDSKVMGKFVISSWIKWLGWAAAVVMAVAVAAMFWTMK